MKQWPVLRLRFPAPPTEEAWEIFCAQATALLGVLGIEGPTSPAKGSGKLPEAVLYFPDTTDPSMMPAIVREMAERSGITLIGFLRTGRFNLYTVPERIEVAR